MRHGRRDGPHTEVRDTFRALGASVMDLGDAGDGKPDLLVGILGTINDLVEVKSRSGQLREKQADFAATWRGAPVYIIRSGEEAKDHFLKRRLLAAAMRPSTPPAPPRTGAPRPR